MRMISLEVKPEDYLGRRVRVAMKLGGVFNYNVTGCGPDYYDGFDDERLNIRVYFADVDYIMG